MEKTVKKKADPKTGAESIYDRLPPQALEAEAAVLGSMMIDHECFGRIIEIIEPQAFYKTAHQKIFAAAVQLYERNQPIDLITLSENLKKSNQLEEIGGAYYLTELAESVPSSANVEFHARIVLEKYLLRSLITESSAIAKSCYNAEEDVYDIIDKAEQKIFSLSDNQLRQTFQHISPIMHDAFETIEKFHHREGSVTGVPTGFTKLDEMTSGLQQGELIIVAGRPSMGKTAFCLNIARNAAVGYGVPVGIFSLEMSKRQLALRMLCAEAQVDAHGVRTGKLAQNEWAKLSMTVGSLTEAPIYIDDTPGVGVLEMRAKARRLKKENKIGMLIIDYLQLMQGPRSVESRQQEISAISRSLKNLAKELDIPVIALSQLSRAVEARGGDKRPMLSDLRESGAIEQDADVVMFIYRPEFYGIETDHEGNPMEGMAEVIIGKQRNGPVGTVHLSFVKRWVKFANPAYGDKTEAPF